MSYSVDFKMSTHFSPDEDLTKLFLETLSSTTEHLRIGIYGFHIPTAVDEIIKLHEKGVDVAIVCDHLQARGHYENESILKLLAAGVPLLEGTSQEHKIMHHKFMVVDKKVVLAGSWNFSLSATEESNYFDIIHSEERASMFLNIWQEMWNWIKEHEQKYQEG